MMTTAYRAAVLIVLSMNMAACADNPSVAVAPAKTIEELNASVSKIMARKPGTPFYGAHFVSIEPGVTTRTEIIQLFGEPTQSTNLEPAGTLDMWVAGAQVVAALSKDGIFTQLQSIANVNIATKDKRRLGL